MTKDRDKESMRVMEWAPLVDITEDEKEYVIKADLPEVKGAQLPSEWVIMDCFSYGLEHTGQDFQAKIRLIA